jgi:hypothetical protein
MKLRKIIAMATITIALSLVAIANPENLDLQSEIEINKLQITKHSNLLPTPTPGSGVVLPSKTKKGGIDIADKIKTSVTEKSSWRLLRAHNFSDKASLFEWQSKRKHVYVHINEYNSLEEAEKNIESLKDPLSSQILIPVQPQSGLGDKAYWRDYDHNDSFIKLAVKLGRYVISLEGDKEDLLYFASHILIVINSSYHKMNNKY